MTTHRTPFILRCHAILQEQTRGGPLATPTLAALYAPAICILCRNRDICTESRPGFAAGLLSSGIILAIPTNCGKRAVALVALEFHSNPGPCTVRDRTATPRLREWLRVLRARGTLIISVRQQSLAATAQWLQLYKEVNVEPLNNQHGID